MQLQDENKTRDQLLQEVLELRQSLVEQGRANLLISDGRTMSTKRFAAGIAHEINNPLGIISGFAELTLLNPELPPMFRGDIQLIHLECLRAARILHDLLGFSGARAVTKHPVDIAVFLKQVLKLKANEFHLYNIEVTTDFQPGLPQVPIDEDQLVEVMLNVLDNAEQAITGDHKGGEIRITTRGVEDRIRISVKDTGPGITPANLPKIFNPLFTTKEVGQGTGFGLSISLEIIHQHGGAMWAESSPNEGSTFHFELPLDGPVPTDTAEATSPEAAGTAKVSGEFRRIMVVNDELGFRQLLSRALSPGGHVIDLAADWVEAWDLVQSHSYDRIILNLGLPAVSGMQLFERIKDYDPVLAGKCVFITGYLINSELEEAINATGVPYLTKPFAISQIRRIVLETEPSAI